MYEGFIQNFHQEESVKTKNRDCVMLLCPIENGTVVCTESMILLTCPILLVRSCFVYLDDIPWM